MSSKTSTKRSTIVPVMSSGPSLVMRRIGRIRWEAAEVMQRAALDSRRKMKKKSAVVATSAVADVGEQAHAAVVDATPAGRVDNEVFLCEHDPVYTVGRRIKNAEAEAIRLRGLGADFQYALRGGQITFHGPGQLVAYPMVDLRAMKIGARVYIERLEQALINTCEGFGVVAGRTEDTGVWVEDRKIAAIGVQVTHGITWHGFALNCDVDLCWFDHIVPCGIEGKGVTSLTKEVGRVITLDEALPIVEAALKDAF
eukprot:gene21023-32893_t